MVKERFLIWQNRTKCAHFRGSPLFQALFHIKTDKQTIYSLSLCQLDAGRLTENILKDLQWTSKWGDNYTLPASTKTKKCLAHWFLVSEFDWKRYCAYVHKATWTWANQLSVQNARFVCVCSMIHSVNCGIWEIRLHVQLPRLLLFYRHCTCTRNAPRSVQFPRAPIHHQAKPGSQYCIFV